MMMMLLAPFCDTHIAINIYDDVPVLQLYLNSTNIFQCTRNENVKLVCFGLLNFWLFLLKLSINDISSFV